MKNIKTYKYNFANKEITFIFNKLAIQADFSVICKYGESSVLATTVLGQKTDLDYLPLSVEYIERYYAAGKIKSSRFDKRERAPSDEAILTGRLIDRGIRPLFPKYCRNEIQIIVTTLSFDNINPLDVIAANATSILCMVSNLPFYSNAASIKIGMINNEFIINPTVEELEKSLFSLFLTFNDDKVVMIEASGNEVPESIILQAIEFGRKQIQGLIEFFKQIKKEIGIEKINIEEPKITISEVLDEINKKEHVDYISNLLYDLKLPKKDRIKNIEEYENTIILKTQKIYDDLINNELNEEKKQSLMIEKSIIPEYVHNITKKILRQNILENEKRIDGRALNDIRPLYIETGIIPRTHGSALFQRGETQCLSILTLGSPGDIQLIDDVNNDERKKKYIHHYNFPPFATNEISHKLNTGRREIGHGALAEKALIPVLPDDKKNPYTMRIVSEILSSNGSTSMAATCASTLALMDGGIQIKKPVAGIAIGLVTSDDNNFKVLTDIQDYEDFCGDMDFKVTGTVDGITAIQMDTKINGLTDDIIKSALEKAKDGRIFIINKMLSVIPSPKTELSPYAPKILTMNIKPEDVRLVIGKGGENINKIIETTGVTIDIENDGTIYITSDDITSANKAISMIKNFTFEPSIGDVFEGIITRKLDFGLIVEFAPNKDGMVHISEISNKKVDNLNAYNIGDKIKVKLINKTLDGKYSLSIKQV